MKFFEIDKLLNKAEKKYLKGDIFKSFINKENIFPLQFKCKKVSQTVIQKNFNQVQKEIEKLTKSDLNFVYKIYDFKLLGKQRLPEYLIFESVDIFLKIVNKELEYKQFIESYYKIMAKFPNLKPFISQYPFLLIENSAVLDKILLVVEFLLNNPNSNIYIREISLYNIDTKFIENNKKIIDLMLSTLQNRTILSSLSNFGFEIKYNLKYPLPQVRFLLLDSNIQGLNDLTVPIDQFEFLNIDIEKVFIVENKITTLSFPKIKNSIVIFGQGYGVSILKNVKWLHKKKIYYWGDIDLDGYAILSQIRSYFNCVESIFMDIDTFNKFFYLKTVYISNKTIKELNFLEKSELEVYNALLNNINNEHIRIEQEKLPYEYIKEKLT